MRTCKTCLYYYLYNSPGSLPLQSVACQSNTSNSAVTITANKMDASNKTIDFQTRGSEGYTLICVSYIIRYIIYRSNLRLLPVYSNMNHSISIPLKGALTESFDLSFLHIRLSLCPVTWIVNGSIVLETSNIAVMDLWYHDCNCSQVR